MGNRKAKVAVIEFTDYECPFCARFHAQSFAKLKASYIDTGKILYVLKDFPLEFHAHAKTAAIAADCARQQEAYWKMSDALFANQRRLGEAFIWSWQNRCI